MFPKALLLAFSLFAVIRGQQVGTQTAEKHPALSIQQCSSGGSCTTQSRSIVLDSNWRWLHSTKDTTNCYTGNTWDSKLCPDAKTCATNCALDGADYSGTYGITTSGNALTLKFVTQGPYSTNIGSRVYLMESDSAYQMFNLNNQEFTFDVDMSNPNALAYTVPQMTPLMQMQLHMNMNPVASQYGMPPNQAMHQSVMRDHNLNQGNNQSNYNGTSGF
jgi:cellulose 1,4-beta-cellobiosidase